MSRYLGLDLGSTSITAVVIDTAARAVTAISSRANDAELTSPADRARGRSEWAPWPPASTRTSRQPQGGSFRPRSGSAAAGGPLEDECAQRRQAWLQRSGLFGTRQKLLK